MADDQQAPLVPLCVGSGNTLANGLRKTLEASSKETLCLLRLAAALVGSHVNWSSSIETGAYHPERPRAQSPRQG